MVMDGINAGFLLTFLPPFSCFKVFCAAQLTPPTFIGLTSSFPQWNWNPGIKDRDMAGFSKGDNSWPPLSKLETSIDDADCHDDSDRGEFKLEQVFPVYAFGFPSPDPGLLPDSDSGDHIWNAIMQEAKSEADKEPILSSFLYASILCHDCLERALDFVLANRLQNPTLLATQLMDIFSDVIMHDKGIQRSLRLDLQAFKDRDSSCLSYCWVLLYLKGYHSLQSYRIAHALWNQGRKVLALALQSRISEVFGVDIHPAARIGEGILLDHATGVVIGETAVIGNRVSIMQGVTLGGTGKELGNRHPNVGDGALIGASANILGNINIGEGAMVAAGSLVLKDVPPHSMVAGIPAKVIGHADEQDPSLTMKHGLLVCGIGGARFTQFCLPILLNYGAFQSGPYGVTGMLESSMNLTRPLPKYYNLFYCIPPVL